MKGLFNDVFYAFMSLLKCVSFVGGLYGFALLDKKVKEDSDKERDTNFTTEAEKK